MSDPVDFAATPDPTPDAARTAATRRAVLKTAGLVALVGGGGAAFAACAPDTAATPSTSAAPSTSAPASPSPSPSAAASSSAASPSASPSPSATSAAPSGPSIAAAEVPVGGGVVLADADYVVTQPAKGTFKAFGKKCTHQGCPVSKIVDREIICNCHGSHFSIEDGSVQSGPADEPLPEAPTTVSGDQVVITA
jgi:Rieske Fe-S protein